MSVTPIEIERELKRLGAVYKPPSTAPEQVSRIWADVLEGISGDELRAAVGEYMRGDGRYFPRPAEIRMLAYSARKNSLAGGKPGDLRATYLAWEQNNEGPCPVCGAVMQKVTAAQRGGVSSGPERLGILHDWKRHKDRGVPHVGWPHPPIAKRELEAAD